MNNNNNNNELIRDPWLSVHLYFNPPYESFLALVIYPLMRELDKRKCISRFFFIRYSERGPHLRLRVKIISSQDISFINNAIEISFQSFINENIVVEGANEMIDSQNYPLHSIQHIRYEPEFDRYGGKDAIEVGEYQFWKSSLAILDIISTNRIEWDYAMALGFSIKMNLSFIHALNYSVEEILELCIFLQGGFISLTANLAIFEQLGENTKAKIEKINSAFETSFQSQEKQLLPVLGDFWGNLENEVYDVKWIENWVRHSKKTVSSLNKLDREGKLDISAIYNHSTNDYVDKWPGVWRIYQSYVHMTNNRLGIKVIDEPYIIFVIRKFISTL